MSEGAAPARGGPLAGLKVLEFAGLGPAPFCGMMLADMGAEVVRIDRPPHRGRSAAIEARAGGGAGDVLGRGRRSVALDLKQPAAIDVARRLIAGADALIEGFRPGVMEAMGLGPDACLEANPRLVYGRATGWGQQGPLARRAGHDINYLALSGALHNMARRDQPPSPSAGLVGDFGGGGMLLAFGVVCAMLEAQRSGRGQVVDAAIADGSALLAALIYGWRGTGLWNDTAGANMGDSGAFFNDCYRCRDGGWLSVASIEPQFYAALLKGLEIDDPDFAQQWDEARWPRLREKLAARIATRDRDDWARVFEQVDACVAPVLNLAEAPAHPHNVARGTFVTMDGVVQPGPAPRFARTPGRVTMVSPRPGADSDAVLTQAGYDTQAIAALRSSGTVA